MKLKNHPDFPKEKEQPKLSKTMPAGDIYNTGFNNARKQLGEIDLNELIDEEKVKIELIKAEEWFNFRPHKKGAVYQYIAQAIKSSDIWKEKP